LIQRDRRVSFKSCAHAIRMEINVNFAIESSVASPLQERPTSAGDTKRLPL